MRGARASAVTADELDGGALVPSDAGERIAYTDRKSGCVTQLLLQPARTGKHAVQACWSVRRTAVSAAHRVAFTVVDAEGDAEVNLLRARSGGRRWCCTQRKRVARVYDWLHGVAHYTSSIARTRRASPMRTAARNKRRTCCGSRADSRCRRSTCCGRLRDPSRFRSAFWFARRRARAAAALSAAHPLAAFASPAALAALARGESSALAAVY